VVGNIRPILVLEVRIDDDRLQSTDLLEHGHHRPQRVHLVNDGAGDQALATLAYFDQLHLAEEITCPTLVASAGIDEVHPLRTVMPVFEKIRSLKSIIVYPDLEHEYRTDITNHAKAWMDRYLR